MVMLVSPFVFTSRRCSPSTSPLSKAKGMKCSREGEFPSFAERTGDTSTTNEQKHLIKISLTALKCHAPFYRPNFTSSAAVNARMLLEFLYICKSLNTSGIIRSHNSINSSFLRSTIPYFLVIRHLKMWHCLTRHFQCHVLHDHVIDFKSCDLKISCSKIIREGILW